MRTVSGAFSLDLRTTVQPAARAGATFIVNISVGAFQGMMAAFVGQLDSSPWRSMIRVHLRQVQ